MNNSFKKLFNKTDTIIAIIIFAMIVFLWNAAKNFDSVSDLFAQNIPPQLFPQILLVTIGLLTAFIPFEHIFLKKTGKDIDSGRKKKIKFSTYGTMAILLTIIIFSEFLGAYITIFLACLILPIFWGEKNLKLLIPYVILFPLFIILIFNIILGVYFEPGILDGFL
mgnify:FL=1